MNKSILILPLFLLLLTGCNKLTKENYDKIKSGMQYDEVVRLIGDPTECSEAIGLSNCEWKDGDTEVNINFINNKVTITSASGLK